MPERITRETRAWMLEMETSGDPLQVGSDGRVVFAGAAGTSTDLALDLHWDNTDGVVRNVDNIPRRFPYLQVRSVQALQCGRPFAGWPTQPLR